MCTQYAIFESDDTQLYISCETRSGLRPYWTACKCLEMHVLSVCDVLLQMVTVFCLCCSVAVGYSCDVQLQLCPSPPSVFKQLPSTLELPGRLSGLPVPWKQLRCWRCFPSLRSSKPCQRWGQDPQRFQPGCSSWRARTPP